MVMAPPVMAFASEEIVPVKVPSGPSANVALTFAGATSKLATWTSATSKLTSLTSATSKLATLTSATSKLATLTSATSKLATLTSATSKLATLTSATSKLTSLTSATSKLTSLTSATSKLATLTGTPAASSDVLRAAGQALRAALMHRRPMTHVARSIRRHARHSEHGPRDDKGHYKALPIDSHIKLHKDSGPPGIIGIDQILKFKQGNYEDIATGVQGYQ
jgi:hypothetical protein